MEREELLRRYALLCDRLPEGEALAEMDAMRGAYYRTKSYRSGTLLEIEAYPLLPARQREQVKRIQPTSEAQRKLNQRNAEKRMIRLAEANFTERDYYFTGTIEGPDLPSWKAMQRLVRAFIRRWNRARKKAGLENGKYIYVLEGHEDGDRKKRLHWHALLEGGLDRAEIKALWSHGRSRCDELDARGGDGLIPLASYLCKNPQGKRRWAASRNLKKPLVSWADRKISARAARRIADERAASAAALEKLYPGHEVIEVEVRTNPYIPGCYIYARMRRTDGHGHGRVSGTGAAHAEQGPGTGLPAGARHLGAGGRGGRGAGAVPEDAAGARAGRGKGA